MTVFLQGATDLVEYIAYEDRSNLWRLVMERCEHTLCSYTIMEPLLCMTSAWSITCVPLGGALHLCMPTSDCCRLHVWDWAHTILLASRTSHI
jgi:hypothetical protein